MFPQGNRNVEQERKLTVLFYNMRMYMFPNRSRGCFRNEEPRNVATFPAAKRSWRGLVRSVSAYPRYRGQ